MIHFEISFNNESTARVSIRRMGSLAFAANVATYVSDTWAYEVMIGKRCHRGTVTHSGPENFSLISAVLADYVEHHERRLAPA